MYVSDQKIDEAIKFFREHGLRTSEAIESGMHSRTLYYMLEEGYITRLERGLYKLANEGTLSNPSLTEGIETHEVDGIEVKVYNPAKTIADCFKFRNQIGPDIAIEALKDGIRQNKASFREIEEVCQDMQGSESHKILC